MKTPQPVKRRLRVSSGSHPLSKIVDVVPYRPFTQQIDMAFPSNPALLNALQNLRISYSKGKVKLSDVVDKREAFVNSLQGQSDVLLVSHGQLEDNQWCIEPYAHLALCVSKDTYERLGLVGYKLPSKHRSGDTYMIDISLRRTAQSSKHLEKVRAALTRWEEIRQVNLGNDRVLWDVLYCSRSPSISLSDLPWHTLIEDAKVRQVECKMREMCNIRVPALSSTTFDRPSCRKNSTSDALENWHSEIQILFEWVGMACLGSQRLYANDQVNPFVAVYEPPTPSYIGNVMCLQWTGLLPPEFVQQVLSVVTSHLTASSIPFIAMTAHGFTNTPVSYLPHPIGEVGDLFSASNLPLKSPREGGEDTWVLFLTQSETSDSIESSSTEVELKWCLMDSLG